MDERQRKEELRRRKAVLAALGDDMLDSDDEEEQEQDQEKPKDGADAMAAVVATPAVDGEGGIFFCGSLTEGERGTEGVAGSVLMFRLP